MPDLRQLGRIKPPLTARWLLRLALPRAEREFFMGDLEEQFNAEVLPRAGKRAARAWYWQQARAVLMGEPPPAHPWQPRKGANLMDAFWQDVRHGLRTISKNPAFAAVAILTLALGIGANAAIFSVVRSVLLKPLPYPQPEQLVMVWETAFPYNLPRVTLSPMDLQDYAAAKSFSATSAWDPLRFTFAAENQPVPLEGAWVQPGFFSTLGIQPFLGRPFQPEDTRPETRRVILSYGFWKNSFGADRSILGRSIRLSGREYEVIGVMPPEFSFPPPANFEAAVMPPVDVLAPLWFKPDEIVRLNHNYRFLARLKPGVTVQQAQAECAAITTRINAENPKDHPSGVGMEVVSLHAQMVEKVRPALLVISGAVGFLLLIVCANLSNLFLVRAASREKETAVRIALGASRGRLIRAAFTEGLLLSGAGAVAGVVLAYVLITLLPAMQLQIPRLAEISIDAAVVLFAFVLAFVSAIFFGVMPALQASRADVQDSLRERTGAHGRAHLRLRNALISAEVAIAIVLLIGAGLTIRSFFGLLRVDLGFVPQNVITAELALPGLKYAEPAQRANFYAQLLERLRAIPGVTSAAATGNRPLSGAGFEPIASIEGRPVRSLEEATVVNASVASPGYFQTMQIPLIAGREFEPRDTGGSTPVIIVDETYARRHLQDPQPLGKRIKLGMPDDKEEPWREIIGIVKTVRRGGVHAELKPGVYLPHSQRAFGTMVLVLRTAIRPESVLPAVRREVAQLDRELPVTNVLTLQEEFAGATSQPRFTAWLLGFFAAAALVLAAIGAYGVISYSVAQRTHEIGVRMALGASPGKVRAMVLRQGMTVVAAGSVVGLILAVVLGRALRSLLFGVSSTDAITYSIVTALLLATALLACWIPARRATRVDPLIALRHE